MAGNYGVPPHVALAGARRVRDINGLPYLLIGRAKVGRRHRVLYTDASA